MADAWQPTLDCHDDDDQDDDGDDDDDDDDGDDIDDDDDDGDGDGIDDGDDDGDGYGDSDGDGNKDDDGDDDGDGDGDGETVLGEQIISFHHLSGCPGLADHLVVVWADLAQDSRLFYFSPSDWEYRSDISTNERTHIPVILYSTDSSSL